MKDKREYRRSVQPIESDALGVHPSQIERFRRDAHERGVEIDFKPDGTAVFKNGDRQLTAYMKACGYGTKQDRKR